MTFTVPVFEELGIASIETINTSCNESNGSIHIIPYGGNGPYAIEWSHGASNFLEENLISGIYVATISDSETCYTEVEVEIIEFSVESQIENSVCGQPNGSIDLMIQGGQRPFLIDWDNGYNSPSINGLFAGSYSYTVTDLTGCNVQSSINLEDITTLNITSNGGDEGFSNGKFLPQGTNLFWKFDPRRIADRLTIVSSVEGIILDSGNMSSFSGCSCFNGCECVNMVYLADNCSSTIPLVVGSGTVSECIDQCPDGPYPKTAYFIAGELHLEHDAFISINVEGSVCETPGTYWILDVSCAPLNTNHEHDLNFRELNESKNDELKTYPIPSTKHIFIESPPSLLADGLRIINNVGMELIKINNIESSKYKIDITSLDSGIYFLEYQVFGIVKLEKFIVVN